MKVSVFAKGQRLALVCAVYASSFAQSLQLHILYNYQKVKWSIVLSSSSWLRIDRCIRRPTMLVVRKCIGNNGKTVLRMFLFFFFNENTIASPIIKLARKLCWLSFHQQWPPAYSHQLHRTKDSERERKRDREKMYWRIVLWCEECRQTLFGPNTWILTVIHQQEHIETRRRNFNRTSCCAVDNNIDTSFTLPPFERTRANNLTKYRLLQPNQAFASNLNVPTIIDCENIVCVLQFKSTSALCVCVCCVSV